MLSKIRHQRPRRVPLRFTGSLGREIRGGLARHSLPTVRYLSLQLPHLPAVWDGLKILQISDVHAGPFAPINRLRLIRRMAEGLDADLIVFTGDQLDRRASDAEIFARGFQGISAPLGVWGILGNHDHATSTSLALESMISAGIQPLVNQSVQLQREGVVLSLTGVDDLSSPGAGPDFSLIAKQEHSFRICLCHQPEGWIEAAAQGAHLTLAGHTHGGQIALTTRRLNVARMATRYIAGPYRREDAFLYVSRGTGVGALPLRFGAPPEIDLLTLRTPAMYRPRVA